jgi:lipopolysaccharide transport system ATP-binding protein
MKVISVEGLAKSYMLKHQQAERYKSLRDELMVQARRMRKLVTLTPSGEVSPSTLEEFWALKDVSFNVEEGERLGIVGRNGAGKSTLLKILSRITEPTRGRLTIRGRVATLLEVGTGFHPELTGRENVFLNGSILGMSRREISQKFDEIVAFAEIEKFLDTPVKRYSSGMYVRLAFAVAAHLESDVLVVDEVLAVGDAQFQRKCLGRMNEISRNGRTILFVSHNMNAVRQLCTSILHMRGGEVASYSHDVDGAIRGYLQQVSDNSSNVWMNNGTEYKNPHFLPKRFYIASAAGEPLGMPIRSDQEVYVTIEADVEKYSENLTVGYAIYTKDGVCLYWSYNTDVGNADILRLESGSHVLRSKLPQRLFNEGSYELELIGGLHFTEWLFEPRRNAPMITLEIEGGVSDSPYWVNRRPTVLSPVLTWKSNGRITDCKRTGGPC